MVFTLSIIKTQREIQVTPFPQPSHRFTQKLHVASYCYFHQLCTLKKYNIVLNSRAANNGIYNTTLKKNNKIAWLSRGEKQQMVFMEGSYQCPPSPQSVTDLHSEGRPSDFRHWARRCLNHFWRREMCKITCHILKKNKRSILF